MITRAGNAITPQHGPQVTVPEPADRRRVTVRVVDGQDERHLAGTAHAWTAAAVYVAWSDDHRLQHRDWFNASDVQAG